MTLQSHYIAHGAAVSADHNSNFSYQCADHEVHFQRSWYLTRQATISAWRVSIQAFPGSGPVTHSTDSTQKHC